MAANMTMAEASKRLEAERVPYAMVVRPGELPLDPHAVAVGMFEERRHPVAGRTRLPRHPILFGHTPATLGTPAPALGEHTDAILAGLGWGERIGELRANGVVS